MIQKTSPNASTDAPSRVSRRLSLSSPPLPLVYPAGDHSAGDGDVTLSADGLGESRSSTFVKEELVVPHIALDRQIGAGGMGSVWYGTHATLKAPVAVKFLRPSLMRHPVAIARFQREAAAAARLRSSNVVQVFDHGFTESGIPYIVMEWLEGISLQERWEAEGQLTVAETIEVVRQTARALARAHAIGIVHRDIKPDNIFLLDNDGEMLVKVLDFGIAKMLEDDDIDRVTADGLVIGTPHFMSPEQMVGAPDVGPAADIWALGVVAYACLTGRLPYEATNVAALALAMDRSEPAPVGQLVPNVPNALEAWICRALRVNPGQRFQDGRTALEALDRALGRGSSAPNSWSSKSQIDVLKNVTRASSTSDQSAYVLRSRAPARPARRGMWTAIAAGTFALSCLGFVGARVSSPKQTVAVHAASGALRAPLARAATPEPPPPPRAASSVASAPATTTSEPLASPTTTPNVRPASAYVGPSLPPGRTGASKRRDLGF